MDKALVEAEVAQPMPDLAIFYVEGAVAGHAGEDLLVRIHLADIPAAGNQDAFFGGCDHLLDRAPRAFRSPMEDDVHGGLADFIGQWESMPGGSDSSHLRRVLGFFHLL